MQAEQLFLSAFAGKTIFLKEGFTMKKDGYYSSGEFARMAHVTLRTIRYYDKQNILKPSYVTESGARFYTDEDFARLSQILLLKYLGFSLDDIREMTIDDSDYHFMENSLNIQLKLVRDRIEQMQLVEKAIQDTTDAIRSHHAIDWNQMLDLIHLTGMEKSMKNQYQNASNISSRINLHSLYSQNKQGWFPWVYEQCQIHPGMRILELGCGDGVLWTQNISSLPGKVSGDIFPFMRTYIENLTERSYQNRTIGLIENGSWAPAAARIMQGMFEKSKNITWLENNVKITSSLSEANEAEIEAMAEELCK